MWISLKLLTVEGLQSENTEELQSHEVFIRNMSPASFKANVRRIARSVKPLILLNGLFNIRETTLVYLAQPAFVVYVSQDSIICSLIENKKTEKN
ncbi:hypothetical protein CAEBREN_04856 [Caenorhabditis brenneri]|uniref:Uncharacterized protein n=1 Tax=Caenorhabditis brenneri TaxID=135651 RepID=G0NI54_CAEBE|nr:hypothetical protein CAEBREN_04856 [Caenorhabditis brenneri]